MQRRPRLVVGEGKADGEAAAAPPDQLPTWAPEAGAGGGSDISKDTSRVIS